MKVNPLLIVSIAYLIGLFLSFYKAVILVLPILALTFFFLYSNYRAIFIFATVLILAIIYGKEVFHLEENLSTDLKRDTNQKIYGQVIKIEPYFDGCKIWLRTKEFEIFEILSNSACNIRPGFYCEFVVRTRKQYINPFAPIPEERILSKGISGELRHLQEKPFVCIKDRGPIFETIRQELFDFSTSLSPIAQGLFQALVLGIENQLPAEYLDNLKDQGLYHQLAISGFNLAILYFLLYFIFRKILRYVDLPTFGFPRQIIASLLALPGAGLILIFSGFQPSAQRAFFFLLIFLISKLFFRNTPSLYLLLLTALFLTIFSPHLIGNISFQLSFLATLAIIVSGHILPKGLISNKFIIAPLQSLLASTLATLFTAPLILKISGSIPLFSPINNLIYTPIWSFLFIPGSIICALISFLNVEVAKILMENIASVFEFFINFPFLKSKISLTIPFNQFLLILLLTFSLAIVILKTLKRPLLAIFIAILFFILSHLYLKVINDDYFMIIIPKLYKERAIIVKDTEISLLILRIKENGQIAKLEIEPMLRKFGISRLDAIVIENPLNEKNFLKLEKLNDRFEIDKIYFYDDLLNNDQKIFDLNRELIPIDENMYLLEFYGLTILIINGTLKKMLIPQGIEIIYTDLLFNSFENKNTFIIEERSRESAIVIVKKDSDFYLVPFSKVNMDVLTWFLFPFLLPDGAIRLVLQ